MEVTNTSHDENVDVAPVCHTWVKVYRVEREFMPKNGRGERTAAQPIYAVWRRTVDAG